MRERVVPENFIQCKKIALFSECWYWHEKTSRFWRNSRQNAFDNAYAHE